MERTIFNWARTQDIVGKNKDHKIFEYLVRTNKGGPLKEDEKITYGIRREDSNGEIGLTREIVSLDNIVSGKGGWAYSEQISAYKLFCGKNE